MDQDRDEKYIEKGDYRLLLNGIKSAAKSHGVVEPIKGTLSVDLSGTIGTYTWIKIAGSVYDSKNGGIILLVKTDSGKSIVRYKEDGTIQGLTVNNTNLNFEDSAKVKMRGDLLIWQEREKSTQIINVDDALNDTVIYDSADKLSLVKKPPLYTIEFGYGYDPGFHGSNVFRRMFQFRQQYIYLDNLKSCFGNTSDIAFNSDVFDIEDNVIQKQNTKNFIDIQFNSGDETVEKIRIAAREGNRRNWFEIGLIDKSNPRYVHSEQEGSGDVSYENALSDNTNYYFRFFNTGGYIAIAREEIEKPFEFMPIQSDTLSELAGNRIVMGQNIHDYKDISIGSLKMSPQYSGLPSSSGVYRSIKRGRYYQGAIRALDGYGRSTEPVIDENLKFYVEDAYDTTNAGIVQLLCENIDTVTFPDWAEKYQFLLTSPYIPFIQIPILYADQYRDADGETDGTIALLIGFTIDALNDKINDDIEETKKELENVKEEINQLTGGIEVSESDNEYPEGQKIIKTSRKLSDESYDQLFSLRDEKEELEKDIESLKRELGNSYKKALANLRQYDINRNDRIRLLKKDFVSDTYVDQSLDLQILDVLDENAYYDQAIGDYSTQSGLWLKVNSPELDGYTLNDVKQSSEGWEKIISEATGTLRYDHGVAVDTSDNLYIIGGFSSNQGFLNDVWKSTDGGETWTKQTSSAWSSGRARFATIMDEDRIYVMGGETGSGYSDEVYYSDDEGANWTLVGSADWSARIGHDGIKTSGGRFFIMGGRDGSNDYLQDVWYNDDPVNNVWTEISYGTDEVWSARRDHLTLVNSNGRVFVIGGKEVESGSRENDDYNPGYLDDVWYNDDPVNNIWTQSNSDAEWGYKADTRYVDEGRTKHAGAIASDNKMIIMGGHYGRPTHPLSDVWVCFDNKGEFWYQSEESVGWDGRHSFSVGIDSNDSLYVIGGSTTTQAGADDVWYNPGDISGLQWINSLAEIYKPSYSDSPNRFYEISGVYDVSDTTNKTFNPANCFLKKRKFYSGGSMFVKGTQSETWIEDAHLTHDFRSDNYTIGRAFIRTGIEKGISHPSIVYTNPHFIGTQINGLSQANYSNVAYLPDEYGNIYSLQNQAGILKVIQAHRVTAFYQTENRILGRSQEFQSNYGSVHPATIVQSPKGYIYGFDVYRQTPWRDTGNGIHPLAGKASVGQNVVDYKMEYFFNRMARQLRSRGNTEGSNDVVAGFDTNENFYYLSFVNNIEDEGSEAAAGMGTEYYNTAIFSEHDNRWIGFVNIIPQKYGWGENMLLSSNGSKLWLHNSDDVDRLSLYGSASSLVIEIVSNEAANVIKVFEGLRLHSSAKMTIDPITIPSTDTSSGREMRSKLTETLLKERGGVYESELLKNMRTTSNSDKINELFVGDEMRGFTCQLRLISSETEKFELFKIDIISTKSF
ncbi:MAG: hypothetical protein R6U52_00260 [Kosmotogaceae bacterium]